MAENIKLFHFVCEGCGATVEVILIANATDEQLAAFRLICPCHKIYETGK